MLGCIEKLKINLVSWNKHNPPNATYNLIKVVNAWCRVSALNKPVTQYFGSQKYHCHSSTTLLTAVSRHVTCHLCHLRLCSLLEGIVSQNAELKSLCSLFIQNKLNLRKVTWTWVLTFVDYLQIIRICLFIHILFS